MTEHDDRWEGTPLGDLLGPICAHRDEEVGTERVDDAEPFREVNSESKGEPPTPFLSVLMRTQGRRLATIHESLLAMAAQTSQNFEVLLLAHGVPRQGFDDLHELVDSFGLEFSGRVRIIAVEGGGRSRPLNVGIDEARGEYIAILDDDDVVFGHWVATFEHHAIDAHGGVIRCVPAEQSVRPTTWPGGEAGYEITSRPRCPWPVRFDLLDHLYENRTPPCSFALARRSFNDLGIRFDESLPVLEDWDVLLRVAMLEGVLDTGEVTALWRKWDTGDSSTFVHSSKEWRQARKAVISKLDSRPLLLPAHSLVRLQALVASQDRFQRRKKLVIRRLSTPMRVARRLRRRFLSRVDS